MHMNDHRPGKVMKASTIEEYHPPQIKEPTVNFHAKFPLSLYIKLSEISEQNEMGRNEIVKKALTKLLYS